MGNTITLGEAMLRLSSLVQPVYQGVASGGSATYLEDANLRLPADTFENGTVWILSGDQVGSLCTVKTHAGSKLTFIETLAGTVDAGDEFAASTKDFPRYKLKQAICNVLMDMEIPKIDTSLTASAGSCILTSGSASISDIRRVFVDDQENFHWDEEGGIIHFGDNSIAGDLEIRYAGKHNDVEEDDYLDPAVLVQYVLWSAAVILWREYIQRKLTDNPTAVELLNEAKQNEAAARQKAKGYQPAVLKRAPRYSDW